MDKKISSIFSEWIESISMHGLANIFRKKHLAIRIIWIISFLASSGACIFNISSIVGYFLNYDVITKIRVQQKDSLIFPAVTVCNYNPFSSGSDLDHVSNYLKNNFIQDFPNSRKINRIAENENTFYVNHHLARFFSVIDFKLSLANSEIKINQSEIFEKMFISCLFNSESCKKSEWSWFYDPFYGNCFTFNGKDNPKLAKTSQPGKVFGLILEINIGIPNDVRTLSISSGAHVYINDKSIQPLFSDGLDISSGTFTNIVLERFKINKVPKPYSECTKNLNSIDSFDSEYYKKVFRSNLTYRQQDCLNAYIHFQVLLKCFCSDLRFNIVGEGNVCNTFEELFCSLNVTQNLVESSYQSKIEEYCPLECETISYNTKLSQSKYPSESYGKGLSQQENIKILFNKSNISLEELRENILGINVYYEHMKETEISERISLTESGLIGSIGGTLGLFLGMSFLSFVDFIDLFFQFICAFISKKGESKVSNSGEN